MYVCIGYGYRYIADCFVLDNLELFYHCNIVQYSYYPHIIITNYPVCISTHTLKNISSIINCNTVPYSYSVAPHPVYTGTDLEMHMKMSITNTHFSFP